MTKPDQRLLELIASFEAFRPDAYVCPGGVWTVGYGTTVIGGQPVKRGDTITKERAWEILAEQVGSIRDEVRGLITWEPPEHVLDALTSFAYNTGIESLAASTALKRLNAGTDSGKALEGAAVALKWWNKAKDPKTGQLRVLGGLVARREAEADLMLNGWDGTAGGTPMSAVENKPTLRASRGVWALIATAVGGAVPMLAVALPAVIGSARGVADQVALAASPQDLLVAVAAPIVGALWGIWVKRDDLRKGSFGSQGRT